ncbi:hypothetical protein BIV25_07175 [Streptomyces sp. MUSC 14]|uniref:hypothetical protein n=1 Tax=Streptomyces sp. MUSC 14 TaxID=1354889 RepID=UPI0008F5A7BE|nr:hypothetical protein [Streptomyces sp. MUSC 14]OIK00894.1 hypothetical protein BIV25_07175 [Streptomyces sp. MUSC 14]
MPGAPETDELLEHAIGSPESHGPRLLLFTLAETHELLGVLQHFGTTDHDRGAWPCHFAAELAARVPFHDACDT